MRADGLTPKKVAASDDCEVVVADTSVVITKTANKKTYLPGEVVQYTLHVSNAGDIALENLTVEDTYISTTLGNIKFVSSSINGVQDKGNYVLIEKLGAKATAILNYEVQIPEDAATGNYTNLAIVKGFGYTYNTPHIIITKKADRYVYIPEEEATYVITVTNDGSVDLTDVYVEDSLNGEFINNDNYIGDLKVGESKDLYYSYKIPKDIENVSHITQITDKDILSNYDRDKEYYNLHNIATVTGKGTYTNSDGETVSDILEASDDEDVIIVLQDEIDTPNIPQIQVIK